LIVPNPESALNEEAGRLLLEDYDEYYSHAKMITSIHATPKKGVASGSKPAKKTKKKKVAGAKGTAKKAPQRKKRALKRL
jgi:ubiquitin-conjugating enzyme E2 S